MKAHLEKGSWFLHQQVHCSSLLLMHFDSYPERRSGLVISVLNSGLNSPGASPGQEHWAVFLGKALNYRGAFLHPGVKMGTSKFKAGVIL